MKKLLFLLMLSASSSLVLAQPMRTDNQQAEPVTPGHIHLQGTIAENGRNHPYIVNMEVKADGSVTGYSLTVWPGSVLKATISGTRDKQGNLILKETPDPKEAPSSTAYYFTAYLSRLVKDNVVYFDGFYTSASASGVPHEGGMMTITAGGNIKDDPAPTNTGLEVSDSDGGQVNYETNETILEPAVAPTTRPVD